MTDENLNEQGQKPAFYIYQPDNGDNNLRRIGAVFTHKKGKGFNIVIGEMRLVAFPPKAQI